MFTKILKTVSLLVLVPLLCHCDHTAAKRPPSAYAFKVKLEPSPEARQKLVDWNHHLRI